MNDSENESKEETWFSKWENVIKKQGNAMANRPRDIHEEDIVHIPIWLVWQHDEGGVALRAIDTSHELARAHKLGLERHAETFGLGRTRIVIEQTETNHSFAFETLEKMRTELREVERRNAEYKELRDCATCNLSGNPPHMDCGKEDCISNDHRDWQTRGLTHANKS